jgi:hypothetical protein
MGETAIVYINYDGAINCLVASNVKYMYPNQGYQCEIIILLFFKPVLQIFYP